MQLPPPGYPGDSVGRTIDRYKLRHQIGEGGFGVKKGAEQSLFASYCQPPLAARLLTDPPEDFQKQPPAVVTLENVPSPV